jgi:hypothetical protein
MTPQHAAESLRRRVISHNQAVLASMRLPRLVNHKDQHV